MANRVGVMGPSTTSTPSINQGAKPATGGSRATNNANVVKRLQSELMALMTSPTPGISAFPANGADMLHWNATVSGPADTVYAGKTFKLTIAFPPTYPYAPPEVLFKTPVYHPNIDFAGRICLSILNKVHEDGGWSAALNTGNVLLSIQSLLGEPNPASPLNGEAARLWEMDREEYARKVMARHQEPEEMEQTNV